MVLFLYFGVQLRFREHGWYLFMPFFPKDRIGNMDLNPQNKLISNQKYLKVSLQNPEGIAAVPLNT